MQKLRSMLLALVAVVFPAIAIGQTRTTVTGTVVSAEGQPLPGAVVQLPSARMTTTTNERGVFAFANVPAGTHNIRVNLIGYKQTTREVSIGSAPASVTITMAVDVLRLDEVIAVGYGEERRRNLAGAVASLKPAQTVKEVPVTNLNQVMQGRLAGVQVVQNTGTPGAGTTVRIRGSSSISGGTSPLYVIDGVPMTQGNVSNGFVGFGGQGNDALNDLNPNEIEDVQILKDASAAAIYGSRASNGVVLIKTKRGIAGAKPEVTFNAYTGTQKMWRIPGFLNAAQYTEIYNEACMARYGATCVTTVGTPIAPSPIPNFLATLLRAEPGVDTNWIDEVTQSAPMSSMDAGIRGGTEKVRYYVNGSLLRQDGVQTPENFDRINGRVNLDYNPYSRLSLGTNVALAHSVNHRARNDNTIYGAFANAIAQMPIQPTRDAAGNYYETSYANPVALLTEADARDRSIRILGNAFANYEVVSGVNARFSVGLDNLTMRQNSWDSPTWVQGPWAANGGMVGVGNSFISKLTYEGTVNFNRLLREGHEISGVVGGSYENNVDERDQAQGTNFPNEFFKYITSAAIKSAASSTHTDWGLTSMFGRLSYTYNDKVTGTFNVRRDGSSRFGTNNRYGVFPSGSLLWRVGEESFLKNQNVIGNLAVRVSYGVTGNQQDLGNFASRGLFGGGSNWMDQPGIAPSQLANPDLKWERTKQFNIGTDFSVLNDRLAITFDWYNKKTTDLLVSRPVPRTTGFNSVWTNVGSMENKGFETGLTARWLVPRSADGFNFSSTLSVAHNANKVLELYNHSPITGSFASRIEEGKPMGFFFGYVVEGIFQDATKICTDATGKACLANGLHAVQTVNADPRRATAPGDLMFKDLNGDGIINASDREMIGNPWPKYEGGLTNNLSWKNFDATAFFNFSRGNDLFYAMGQYTDQQVSSGDNNRTTVLDRWRPDRTNTNQPRAIMGDPNQNSRNSSRWIEDGSFVRLKNLVLGYKLPASLASRGGFRTARLYVQGQNVKTWTNYSGFDPEVNYAGDTSITRGTDFYTIPQSRVWTFGINVTF